MNRKLKTTRAAIGRSAISAMALCILGAAPLTGCRGERTNEPPRRFFPDMDHQPKIKPQSEADFFYDGSSQRRPVEGVVSFGPNSVVPDEDLDTNWASMRRQQRDDLLQSDETYYYGLVEGTAGSENLQWIDRMPIEVTEQLIERGAERYNIYCSMCHGYDALGNDSGSVGRLMNVRPVNLLDERYRDREGDFGSDGYIFHVIREGLWSPDGTNRMPPYGHAVDEHDAWAIVAYVRVLQAAFDAQGNPAGSVQQDQPDTTPADQGGDQ